MKFYCGVGQAVITPEIGTCLYGYYPGLHSESVHDDLKASVIAVGNGVETALLMALTLGDINSVLCDEFREIASEASGVPAENIIVTGTHTHCGPNTSGIEGWGDVDRAYIDSILIPGIRRASADAVAGMTEAVVGTATGHSDVGINRREQRENGEVVLGQNPWGSYDPTMTVTVFRRADNGGNIVNLVHYGCHGTACGAGTEITQDWSGVMLARMELMTGTVSVFYNGSIGDVGPRLTNGCTVGNISHVEELGSVAAVDAMRIYRTVRSFTTPELRLHRGTVRLPYQKFPTLAEAESRVASFADPDGLVNVMRLEYQHYADVAELLRSGKAEDGREFSYPVTIITLGDTVFIPIPFEHFSEISLRLREYTGYAHTLTLSCANGYFGYLPTEDQLCRGGYEVSVFRYASLYSLADNTDQNIINENLRILREN